jgi:hypothetical protein
VVAAAPHLEMHERGEFVGRRPGEAEAEIVALPAKHEGRSGRVVGDAQRTAPGEPVPERGGQGGGHAGSEVADPPRG